MSDELEQEKQRIYEYAQVAFKKLSPKDGDIVIVQFPKDILSAQMELFAAYMEDAVPANVTVFCTKEGTNFECISKEELNAKGWYNFAESSKAEH